LNELLIKCQNDYANVMATCKAYESSAKLSADNADESEANAKTSEDNAKESERKALESEANAKASEIKAKAGEDGAKEAEANADSHAQSAQESAEEARSSAEEASASANAAEVSKMNSLAYQITAHSYAVGGTGQRIDEDTDNAKYYYTQTKSISDNLGGVFAPMGTIEFSQLQSVEKSAGYVYHITDAFVSDDTFKSGAGVSYPAGTSVYYTADGYWDCISGKFISDAAFNTIMDTIKDLQGRIEELENQVVLGITE
jgi:chemotaxis protein histidine kinase CheA